MTIDWPRLVLSDYQACPGILINVSAVKCKQLEGKFADWETLQLRAVHMSLQVSAAVLKPCQRLIVTLADTKGKCLHCSPVQQPAGLLKVEWNLSWLTTCTHGVIKSHGHHNGHVLCCQQVSQAKPGKMVAKVILSIIASSNGSAEKSNDALRTVGSPGVEYRGNHHLVEGTYTSAPGCNPS